MESYFFYYLILINIVAFALMLIDKKRAVKGQYRIPEKTLWVFSIIGGALGAFIAMEVVRHKTKHVQFKLGLPALTIIEGVFVYWLFL